MTGRTMQVNDRRKLRNRDVSFTVMGLAARRWAVSIAGRAIRNRWAPSMPPGCGHPLFRYGPILWLSRSERRLGTMLTEHERGDYVVSTKVGRVMVPDETVGPEEDTYVRPLPFRPVYDYTYDAILKSFEASQQRLGVLKPDLLYVHDIGRVTHNEKHEHYWQQLTKGGGFKALGELRAGGQIKAVGLGVNEWQAVWDAMDEFDIDAAMLAGRYTLIEQESLKLLDRAEKGWRRHRRGRCFQFRPAGRQQEVQLCRCAGRASGARFRGRGGLCCGRRFHAGRRRSTSRSCIRLW